MGFKCSDFGFQGSEAVKHPVGVLFFLRPAVYEFSKKKVIITEEIAISEEYFFTRPTKETNISRPNILKILCSADVLITES